MNPDPTKPLITCLGGGMIVPDPWLKLGYSWPAVD